MRYIGNFFHDAYKVRCYWRWWAGLDSNQRSRWARALQAPAIAAMRPTHILNKYVKGGRHYQRQNIDKAYVKERRAPRFLRFCYCSLRFSNN